MGPDPALDLVQWGDMTMTRAERDQIVALLEKALRQNREIAACVARIAAALDRMAPDA